MTKTISLSKETLEILDIASKINNSIGIDAGSSIKTLSVDGAVAMIAGVKEEFPENMVIYDLSQFLSILKQPTFQDATLNFSEDNKVVIKAGKAKVNFWYAAADFVKSASKVKDINIDPVDLEFVLTAETLDAITRGASLLGHKLFLVRVSDNVLYLAASTDIDTSNILEIDLGTIECADISFKFSLSNIKLIRGDYKVQISSSGIAKFAHVEGKSITFIGVEAD